MKTSLFNFVPRKQRNTHRSCYIIYKYLSAVKADSIRVKNNLTDSTEKKANY